MMSEHVRGAERARLFGLDVRSMVAVGAAPAERTGLGPVHVKINRLKLQSR